MLLGGKDSMCDEQVKVKLTVFLSDEDVLLLLNWWANPII